MRDSISSVRTRLAKAACAAIFFAGMIVRAATSFVPQRDDPLVESWRWRSYPELNGLGMQSFAEADDGALWFSTAESVWRYDGFEWTKYSAEQVNVSTVYAFCPGRDGATLAGGRNGLARFANGQWARIFSRAIGEVRALARAPDGAIWAATAWGALELREGTWTLWCGETRAAEVAKLKLAPAITVRRYPAELQTRSFRQAQANRRDQLVAVRVAPGDGAVWFGTTDGEILRFDPAVAARAGAESDAAWRLFNEDDGLVVGRTPSVLPTRHGPVWVTYGAGSGHANVWADGRWTPINLGAVGVSGDVGELLETTDGAIWLSGRYEVAAWRDGRWRRYARPEVPIPQARNSLLQTRDGALWIAGPSTEILRVDYATERWQRLPDLNFQCVDAEGGEWFLHRSGAVVHRTRDRWTRFGVDDGVIDTPVVMVVGRGGEVWAAGSHGGTAATARFSDGTWTRFIHERFAWGVDWRGVLAASDSAMWFAAAVDSSGPAAHKAGLLEYRDGTWRHHYQPGRSPRDDGRDEPELLLPATQRPEPIGKFLSLGESPAGRLWAGRNILITREAGAWRVVAPPAGMRFGIIEMMFTSREHELWIGTREFGAVRFDGTAWERMQGKGTLVANSVRAIAQSSDGAIWAGTDRGFGRFDGKTWSADRLPGVLTIPHEGGSLKAGRDGELWVNRFAPDWMRRGWKGAARIDPDTCEFWTMRHTFRGAPPETAITGGTREVARPGNIWLAWTAASPWRNDSDAQLEFSYRIDNGPWSAFTAERGHAYFTLASGRHRFEVRARDVDFNVDPTPAVLEFAVAPPVWRQVWFVALILVLGGAAVAQSVRVFLERERLRKANRGLAAEIEEHSRAEERIRQLNRTYAVLSEINQLIVRDRSVTTLCAGACRIAVELGGFRMAWIGLLDDDQRQIRPAASAGIVDGYIDGLCIDLGNPRMASGPTARTLISGAHHIYNDIATDPEMEPWREAARQRGYRASATFPLKIAGRVTGTFNLYSDQAGLFDAEEVRLLDELAMDIGFALEGCERELARERAVAQLKSSEERFREIAETIEDVFWITDPAKRQMLYISPAYEKVWGRTCRSLIEHPLDWLASVHPEDRARVRDAAMHRQETGGYDEEYRIVRPDGNVRWVRDRAFPVRNESGKLERMLGVARDITVHRMLEEQFRQSQKMEAVGQLAGGVAHDFNNILAAMLMQVELLASGEPAADELREGLKELRQETQRAANLTRQLLLFSRRQVMQPRELELSEVVTNLAKMLQRIIGEDVRLEIHPHPTAVVVRADAGMLEQVVLNLVVNARDAMPGGGRLRIETAVRTVALAEARGRPEVTPGVLACLSVTDSGCGIPPEVLPRIFEPFFTTKAPGKGTGLGLATVFGIVRQHRGWINVTSQPGVGTTFEVLLPLATPTAPVAAPVAVAAPAAGGTETILVVEDEPSVRALTVRLLQRCGYRVLSAGDGREALEIWRNHHEWIALILTDLVLPEGLGGPQLARQLRAEKPGLRIVFTSGYSAEMAGRELTLDAGEHFLPKPFTQDSLRKIVRGALDAPS